MLNDDVIVRLQYFSHAELLLLLSVINTLQAAGVRDPDHFNVSDHITLVWSEPNCEKHLVIDDKCRITCTIQAVGVPHAIVLISTTI